MAFKETKRKGFNFFRSYFDVYNELETNADKVAFMNALLERQFLGIKPTELKGLAKFAYISQTNSIDSQVKGYNDKMKRLGNPLIGGDLPPTYGGYNTPTEQVEEKEEVEEKEKYINTSAKADAIDFNQLLLFINKTLNKNFRTINSTLQAKYKARLKDGYTKEDIQKAIIGASKSSYHLETNYRHLRPEFFSRADKIDMYSNTGTIPNKNLSIKERTAHITNNINKTL